jgi:hypothetical protein
LQDPQQLIQAFDSSVPMGFQYETVRHFNETYKQAARSCRSQFGKHETHDLLPHLRRAMVERDWRALTNDYSGMTAKVYPNHRLNCFHAELRSGLVVLTESAVDSPDHMVRYAEFRQTRARDCQLSLFLDMGMPSPDPDALLYAILLHGPMAQDPSRMAFIKVAFPSPTLDKYLASIDLFKRFPDLVEPVSAIQTEIIDDDLPLRLKRHSRKREEA